MQWLLLSLWLSTALAEQGVALDEADDAEDLDRP